MKGLLISWNFLSDVTPDRDELNSKWNVSVDVRLGEKVACGQFFYLRGGGVGSWSRVYAREQFADTKQLI